jgi:type II secretory pathway pseudopilin PulG
MMGGDKKTPKKNGFTIVEVMVFLAVSGVIFLIAVDFINGKVAQTNFVQGMNSANAQIQTIINNVADGNYPTSNGDNLDCTLIGGHITNQSISTTTNSYSSNPGCTFVGMVLIPSLTTGSSSYVLLPVVGCQYYSQALNDCSSTSTNSSSTPQAIQQEVPVVWSGGIQQANWPGSVSPYKMVSVSSNGGTVQLAGSVGFFGGLPSASIAGVLSTGAQPVSLIMLPTNSQTNIGSVSVNSISNAVTDLGNPNNSNIFPAQANGALLNNDVVICFAGVTGSTTKGVASITIGNFNGGGQLTTELQLGQEVSKQCTS